MSDPRSGGTLASSTKEDGQHEPEQFNNHSGTGEGQASISGGGGGEEGEMVDVEKSIERFYQNTKLTVRKENSKRTYVTRIRHFAKAMSLDGISKQALQGRKGKDLLMNYLSVVPPASRRTVFFLIKKFWLKGLEIGWPLEKDDVGRFPVAGRRKTPPNHVVLAWKEAMDREPDLYYRLVWRMIAENGWRPSHVGNIDGKNIERDEQGRPIYIHASGTDQDFKCEADVLVRLSPALQEDLTTWLKEQNIEDSNPVLPWRTVGKKVLKTERLDNYRIRYIFRRLQRKYSLPKLDPNGMRHWIATVALTKGMSDNCRAAMQGHKASGMGAHYDNRDLQLILDEQAAVFPDGPLATLTPPKVHVEGVLPDNIVRAVLEVLDGKMQPSELVMVLLDERAKRLSKQTILTK